jgi:hypothetical protein
MKRTLLILGLSLACALGTVHAGDFGDGWARGWEQGWKQVKGPYSLAPFAPFAPFPPLGGDDYESGFAAGVLAGAHQAGQD